jgi:hypothetical protein
MSGGLKVIVEGALQRLPHCVAVGFDHHAAFDDFGGFRHIALEDDVLIPGGEVLGARSDSGFSHYYDSRLRDRINTVHGYNQSSVSAGVASGRFAESQ